MTLRRIQSLAHPVLTWLWACTSSLIFVNEILLRSKFFFPSNANMVVYKELVLKCIKAKNLPAMDKNGACLRFIFACGEF
jgi:hypothetical protein